VSVPARWFAPCAKGFEYLLVDELKALGASEAREALAGAHFSGDPTLGYRACLWWRLPSRVLLPLAEFPANEAAELYAGVHAIDWKQHFAPGRTFAVDAVGRSTGLINSVFTAQKAKDAIVDRLRADTGARPDVDPHDADLRVHVALRQGRAIVSIDLAGAPLHERGWRRGSGDAPMRETLACAMLMRAHWPAIHAAGGPLVDPMCGSGTLLIEGALMAADVAPGLRRERYGFHGWAGFDAVAWQALRDEASARARVGLTSLKAVFHGSDTNAALIGACKGNAQAAGVAGFVHLRHASVARLEPPPAEVPGLVIANPPYGERLGAGEALQGTYREFGEALRRGFIGWHACFITSDERLARATGLRAKRTYTLYNGAIECRLYCIDAVEGGERAPHEAKPLSAPAEGLRNRILKNQRHLKARLAREGIGCYRVYDADIPEYAAAIDVYDGHLHIQEYAPPPEIPPEVARRRFGEIVRAAGEALEVPRERIAVKSRRPQTRERRYERMDERGEFIEVGEGGLRFMVNLHDYLDTGLFLDHRLVRARLRELARGQRFLNLFCYTATASVYAADGGAASTTSVDLSATYLEWAQRNLALNGHASDAHRLVQADTLAWLAAERGVYDLIFVDPPTFSNSKRADDFDVQRDHLRLLELCRDRLAPAGTIVFSNNFRRFKLDRGGLTLLGLEARDTTRASIPFDFARDPRIHQCFELRRATPGDTKPTPG
jgi:23S rRNA (guanine2445-N2)-methyltransferase / 23S rRNA (guanine2069-N7)-methyltransferase